MTMQEAQQGIWPRSEPEKWENCENREAAEQRVWQIIQDEAV